MTLPQPTRIHSIDILRGLIMIIMALDHTRDFFLVDGATINATDLATTTPALFFSRWITHFCAPIFVFLSGISASIALQRTPDSNGSFLIRRGLWLLLMDVTVITFGITFNPLFNVIFLQVIWAIGLSMILLGCLAKVPRPIILITGLVIVVGHDALRYLDLPVNGWSGAVWQLLFSSRGAFVPISDNYYIAILYAGMPWAGVMFVGYGVGAMFMPDRAPENRKKGLLYAGIGTALVFILLRWSNFYGDPSPWEIQKTPFFTLLSFLNVSKYPPSLLFCCMTIGPGMIFLSLTEKMANGLASVLTRYGRVPFFYYLVHWYLIHAILIALFFVTGFTAAQIVSPQMPFLFRPPQFGFSLGIVFVLWIVIVALLYVPCVWYWEYKSRHRENWWTRYI